MAAVLKKKCLDSHIKMTSSKFIMSNMSMTIYKIFFYFLLSIVPREDAGGGGGGLKSRLRPPYPLHVVKGD